jgi:hypothetical protein
VSEHITATEAELAALTCLREGEELVVYDRYHAAIGSVDQRRALPRTLTVPPEVTRHTA